MDFPRRSSVTVAKSSFQAILEERLKKLHGIWNEVGLDQEQRRNRMSTAIAYLEKLLDQMLTEEGEMLETLKVNVENYKQEITKISTELKTLPYTPNDDKPLISLMYDLQTQLQSLQDEKEKRIIQHQCLVEREIELCSKLGRQPTATDLQSPLKQNNLTQLSDKIAALQKLHDERFEMIKQCSKEIHQLQRCQKYMPIDDVELRLIQQQPVCLPLSDEFIEQVEAVHQNVSKKYQEFLANLEDTLKKKYADIWHYWDLCKFPAEKRPVFKMPDLSNFDDSLFDELDSQLLYLKHYYEERAEILSTFDLWQHYWMEKIKLEEKSNDYTRYTNRGGTLLREEKEKKMVERKLVKLRKDIAAKLATWNEEHPKVQILINGAELLTAMDSIEREYAEKKQQDLMKKKLEKQKKLQIESVYGTPKASVSRMPTPNMTLSKRTVGPSSAKKSSSSAKKSNYVYSSLAMFRSPTPKTRRVYGKPVPFVKTPQPDNTMQGTAIIPDESKCSYGDFAVRSSHFGFNSML